MQAFKHFVTFSAHSPKVIGLTVIIPLIALVLLVVPNANAAGETYGYAESGAKIVGKGGSFGSATATFTKGPGQTQGKDQYTASVKVKGKDGDCNIGLQILVSPGATSGAISAPAFLNGLPGAGAAGSNYTPSCDRSFATGVADFNKSISISTASTGNPAPPPTETAGQKEIIATVYSDKKVSTLPTVKISQLKLNTPSTAVANTVSWNSSANIGSTRWSNIDPGSYRVCVTPDNLFNYFDACQEITKVAGKPALVNFGSSANNLNEEGKQVSVTVNLSIPGGTGTQTYGPIGLTLYNSTTSAPTGATGSTISQTLDEKGEGGVRSNGQVLHLGGLLDGVEPGTYKVCVTGQADLCSPAFTKEVNLQAKTEINISEDQSKKFLSTPGQSTCAIEGVGWIICPAISFMATIADSAFSFLSDNFLSVNVGVVASDSSTYKVWMIMRNIANIAFVIAFLFIIFSQLTGQGIANYGIKKMLPRLVIAAILVNVSFFICQIAVDLSNILGYSLNQVFKSIGQGVTLPNGVVASDESGNWAGIATAVIASVGIGWALGVSVLLPFLLGAVIALMMVFLILVIRQMLIILLVVVAPIAFVAFLLPNTEQWFTKWRKMFVALLLVFPMIGLLFGASSLASDTLKAATYSADGGASAMIGSIVAAGIIALPLFLLPSLLKNSLNSVGNIGNKLNGFSDKFSKGARSKAAGTGILRNSAARKAERRTAIATGTYGGRNPISRMRSNSNTRLNSNSLFNAATGGYGAARTLTGQSQQRKDTQEAMSMFAGDDTLVEAWAASGGNIDKVPATITLNEAQKTQFNLIRNSGHARKPTSFIAAAQYMSEGGKGTIESVASAMEHARSAGASDAEIGSSWQGAMASYRKAGRGDMVGEMAAHFKANGDTPPLGVSKLTAPPSVVEASRVKNWGEVSASAVHREGIKVDLDPVTGKVIPTSKSAGYKAYETHLQSDSEHTRQALVGFDSMEQRARVKAEEAIVVAAQRHQLAATGVASTITNIGSAKEYYKLR